MLPHFKKKVNKKPSNKRALSGLVGRECYGRSVQLEVAAMVALRAVAVLIRVHTCAKAAVLS
jgi:hypothetical protein